MIVPSLSSRKLVGRTDELEALRHARRALSSGRGHVVLVGGEAGIGKTRLLSEFAATLDGGRAPIYALGESLADAPRPFGPFRQIVGKLAVHAPSLDTLPLARRAQAALLPATDASSASSSALDKAEIFAGFLQFVEAVAARRAVVLALEDLHWSDAASLELLAHVAGRIRSSRILIVGTYRDDEVELVEPLGAALARMEREPNVTRIRLDPLAAPEVRALIESALERRFALEADDIGDVVAHAEGNPFFVEELLKKAVERSQQATHTTLPISIRAMIAERTARLEPFEREVLEHAAVFGPSFTPALLATIMQAPQRALTPPLRRLRELGLLVEEHGVGRLRFRHALTREAVYERLLSADVQALHERITATLAVQPGAAPVDELAYHAWKAGLGEPALRYNEAAGDAALGIGAAQQAATYYDRALEAAQNDAVRTRLYGKLGEAHVQQSAFERAVAACLQQQALLLAAGDYDGAALAVTRAAAETANGGDVQGAVTLIETFLREHGARVETASANHLYASLARMSTARDDYPRAREALAAVRDPHDLPAFSHQVFWLAQLFVAQHDLDRTAWREAAAALRARNHETYPLMRSQMLHSIASTSIDFAEMEIGRAAIEEAIAIDRELGFARALAYALAVRACLLSVEGRLREACASIEAALAESDMFVVRLELAVGATQAPIAFGNDALAQRCLDGATFDRVRAANIEQLLRLMHGMEAERLYAVGRTAEALERIGEALAGPQHQFAAIHFWPFAARVASLAQLGRLREWCGERARNPDDRVAQACAALLEAMHETRNGRIAGDAAQRAAAGYRELGWPLHEALALETAGCSDEALALYRACESAVDIRRVEAKVPAATPARRGGGLSPREREVALLVAEGMTNRAIATALHVGEKTVEKYVSAIYAKLHFTSRAQLAARFNRSTGGDAP